MDEIFDLIAKEEKRQQETLMLIPSENYTYPEVRRAVGSVLMHKYAEGYPGKRYYQGMEFVNHIENLAIERAKKLFGVPFANVQPYSGSPANMAVYFALLNPGGTIMGMQLSAGGHLTHGYPKITFAGKYFRSVQFGLEGSGGDNYFDYGEILRLAKKNKPKVIIIGTTSFPRILDWEKFAEIADEAGAYFVADISHLAGLVVGGVHPSPVPCAHVVTTTTHKTLRGPRGAVILVTEKGLQKDPDLGEKINKAIFPGLQGGPHLHTIAGLAVALAKAASPGFREYAKQMITNAKVLAEILLSDFDLVTGGTDNHLMVVDVRSLGIGGKEAAERLEKNGIVVNKNVIPNDPGSMVRPSGIRLGTPAVTTRGMKEGEMREIGEMIRGVLVYNKNVAARVKQLCLKFPIKA